MHGRGHVEQQACTQAENQEGDELVEQDARSKTVEEKKHLRMCGCNYTSTSSGGSAGFGQGIGDSSGA